MEYVSQEPISTLQTSSSEATSVKGGIMDMILSPIISGLLGPQWMELLQEFYTYLASVVPSRIGYLFFGTPENRQFVMIWDVSEAE